MQHRAAQAGCAGSGKGESDDTPEELQDQHAPAVAGGVPVGWDPDAAQPVGAGNKNYTRDLETLCCSTHLNALVGSRRDGANLWMAWDGHQ